MAQHKDTKTQRHKELDGFFSLCLCVLVTLCLPLTLRAADDENDPDIELAGRLERAFQKLARKVAPCVVSLEVHAKSSSWLEELHNMGDQFGSISPERQFEGSGVIVDATGLIVTNEHVVRGADLIRVKLNDGRVFSAELRGSDPRSDLAMIRLTGASVPKDLPCAALGDSDKVEAGQWALAVGNPFGLSNTFTVGVVSARSRNLSPRSFGSDVFYGKLIQTDAPINPGNSGGPLFDLRGKLIGINTMIFSKSGFSQGCGFAIPSNHLKPRLAYLREGREIEYGWLGVQLSDLEPGQTIFNVPDNKGVVVSAVLANTPADRAGLANGSVILDFDGVRISNTQELIAAVNDTPVGRSVKVKVLNPAGKSDEVAVRISKRYSEVVKESKLRGMDPEHLDLEEGLAAAEPANAAATALAKSEKPGVVSAPFLWRGMEVKELSEPDGQKRGGRIEIVRVRKGTPADRAGLYEGAILTEFKAGTTAPIQKFNTLEEFKRLTSTAAGPAAIYIPLDGYVPLDAQ